MRTRNALALTALLLMMSLSPVISAADSTVTVNTTWSGSMTLTGNVTVAEGATLTIAPGASIDAGEYGILIQGHLDADDALFFSSEPPLTQGSHGQGMWPGIEIASSGSAELNNVTIANASAALLVRGSLDGADLTFNDAYRGLSLLGGQATIDGVDAHRMDYEAFYIDGGSLTLNDAVAIEVAVGMDVNGDVNASQLTVREAGVGIRTSGGHLNATGVGIVNASVGLATKAGAMTTVSSMYATGVSLAVDASDTDGLTLTNAVMEGERMLVAQGATSFALDDVSFTADGQELRYVLDAGCLGLCSLDQVTVSDAKKGVAWSGTGTFDVSNSNFHGTERAMEASGDGHLMLEDVTLTSPETALAVQTPTSMLSNVHIALTSSEGVGIDVLGGEHDWGSITIEKPFLSSDTSSIGVRAWYSTIAAEQLTMRNLSTSLHLEDTHAHVDTTELNIGHAAGLHLIDSSYVGTTLTTVAQDEGVLMEGPSTIQLDDWTAQLHDTPLMMATGSEGVIRSFSPVNTAPTSSDALGDGVLYYGSSGNPSISVSTAYELLETPVTFTDLQGNPVEADIEVHGFTLASNSNGAITLPLVGTGSVVDATLDGAGVRVTLYGGQTGQSVQVPVIPQGDWTLASGQDVVLGPRPDGQAHQINGNLVVSNNAKLTLQETTLVVNQANDVTLQGSAELIGHDARLEATLIQASGSSMLQGTDAAALTIHGEVEWACISKRTVSALIISGDLTVQPSCEIDLYDGQVIGDVDARTGAVFTAYSALDVKVLDKGAPVEGALISIDGAVSFTDAQGEVSTSGVARTVTDSGETWAGVKTVTLQQNSFSDFVTWDSNQSLSHTFMASTVPSGTISDWLVLEREWSPYTLDQSLTLSSSATMTIQDGVSLRIAEGSTMTINGLLDAGSSILSSTGSGARWGGLVLGNSAAASIELTGTNLVEATPAMTVSGIGEVRADDVTFARSGAEALLYVQSGSSADVLLRNSHFQDSGDGCVKLFPSSGTVTMTNVTFTSCYGSAVWAQQVPLALSELMIGEATSQGLSLTGVTGYVEDVDALSFEGDQSIISLNSINGNFLLSNIKGTVTGTSGIQGDANRNLAIDHILLYGAPAIDIDDSAGLLSHIELIGNNSGTAFVSHHGRSMDSLVVEQLNLSGYSVGLGLHLDDGEISAPFILRDAIMTASTAISTEGYPVRLEQTTLFGTLEMYGADVSAIDGNVGNVDATEGSTFTAYRTFVFDARQSGQPVEASFIVDFESSEMNDMQFSGTTVDVELPYRTVTDSGETMATSLLITASMAGSPSTTLTLTSPASADPVVVFNIAVNQPPTVDLLEPYAGQRVMESEYIRATATASDDLDDASALTFSWKVYDAQGNAVLQSGNEMIYNITDLTAGYYVVEVTATDSYGASSTASKDLEYTQLDTDGDWTSTCSSDTWFDATIGKSCGPNVYDEDDDNDGFSDSKDAFPLDPCAQIDTDGDTQPDVLDCPEGYTSWLTEDMDDDGDGTPDVLEGTTTTDSDTNLNALLVVVTLLILGVLLFFVRLRRGGPGDLTGLDQKHL